MISALITLAAAALLVVIDQGIKFWATVNLAPVGSMPLIPGVVELRYYLNDGAAFSILQGKQTFLILFTGAALLMGIPCIKQLRKIDAGCLKAGAMMGAALYAAYTMQTFGLEYTTPGKNAFLTATYCVLVPFLWWAFAHKRPDRYNISAALVCITTITRMVNDERTQIGTLKALGYSYITISLKYILYASSAALLGCVAGFFLGKRHFL